MADSPPQTSWTRVLLAVAASAVLLFLVLAGSMWFILAGEGVAPPPQAAVAHAGRVVRTGGAEAEAVRDAVAGDRLVVDVVDRAGAAVPGVELVLSDGRGGAERTVTTDGDGTFALEELPDSVWWEVSAEAPWSVFARVAPGETERTIDISGGRASVEATWTGAVPCEVSLRRDGLRAHGDHRCMADGSVLASDLVPGEWTLTVADTTGAQAVRTLVLEAGEARDLGDLAPEGRAEARDTGG
jgi:hypothetical protein